MKQRVYLASKFIIPTVSKEVILVKRFVDKIKRSAQFPLTLIKAGPGYGKSTLLGFYFKNFGKKHFWFSLTGDDNELFNFVYDLIYSVRIINPSFGAGIIMLLEKTESLRDNWTHLINMFINGLWELYNEEKEEIYLIIEDLHRVKDQPEVLEIIVYLADNLPPGIHLAITSRTLPTNFPWQQWKLKGKVLTLSEEDLAFAQEEIRDFFTIRAGLRLEKKVIDLILAKTEGWPIALEMLSESFAVEKIENLDEDISENAHELFAFLAFDFLDKQEKEIRHFLLNCAVLNVLNEDVCHYLMGREGPRLLQQVIKKELFISDYGKSNYRFHSLFRDFLHHVATKENYPIRELHIKVAKYYLDGEHYEEAINQLIKAGEYSQAALLIIRLSPGLIEGGRFNTLLYWLKAIPEEIYNVNPYLYIISGDIFRLTSEFHLALNSYDKAEYLCNDNYSQGEITRRKALVYLDTVQPSKAEPLLKEALQLMEYNQKEQEKAGLLFLIAENNLNSGKIDEFYATKKKAEEMNLDMPTNLYGRFLLRTGRINEGTKVLEGPVRGEEIFKALTLRAHRETKLILSLLNALVGNNCYKVYSLAREGIVIGQKIGSPFTESVAAARMGHSYQIRDRLDKAIWWYLRAVQISEDIRIPRGKGEPLWGLCLAYGFRGQWELAYRYGEEGRKICLDASDYWLVSLTTLSLGIASLIAGNYEAALNYINEGKKLAEDCQDCFIKTVSLLWESFVHWKTNNRVSLKTTLEEMFIYANKYNYGFLLKNKTIWSPRDMAWIQATLLYYQNISGENNPLKNELQIYLKGKKADYHPGYSLNFQTLGQFRVWRGNEEIGIEEWSRDKARKLLQIFAGHRGQYIRSEQLIDFLWPDKTREQGKQNLKVIINTLNKILEPHRNGQNPFFLERNSLGYGLAKGDNFTFDCDVFVSQIQNGIKLLQQSKYILAQEVLEGALELYKGEFLPEMLYEEWTLVERESLRKLYLEGAEGLAQIYLQSKEWTKCMEVCENILNQDCCWENAYQIMILCYCQMKEKILAVQTFQRCKESLAKHLSVKPSQKLISLLKEGISGL